MGSNLTDTVGRMGVDGLHRLQLWVAENKTDINQTGGHDPGTKIETGDAEEETKDNRISIKDCKSRLS